MSIREFEAEYGKQWAALLRAALIFHCCREAVSSRFVPGAPFGYDGIMNNSQQ
ncbi:hypothetical protein [Paenibacillus humicus]|uniref:hypothetical protein n=1 Tax=Paenibacillus humicus TaxID=412861 RepID=UPI003D27819A